ncbi:MAG: hypothetical protein GWN99_15530, partial [Gemmatimonadetes bacterium]|nr:hypothetical protein [Gemmatimonadota bacterium]NIT67442.1 hypothetical protein [Gemmatimonadota bacterium]NIU51577.1 hypothetical protein [Gemmatimonadota bacterium]NIV24908.1 hypothetical protein [Gemmatimonadota bacterium]NIW35273.1 hypothetical protein [Gemmatimonadota bacterium]
MTTNPRLFTAIRLTVAIGGALALMAAVVSSWRAGGIWDAGTVLQFFILAVTAGASRRFGIALPGKGFASFLLAVVIVALLLGGWAFAVIVATVGTGIGDWLVRRQRIRDTLLTVAHVDLGLALVGL